MIDTVDKIGTVGCVCYWLAALLNIFLCYKSWRSWRQARDLNIELNFVIAALERKK